MTAQRHLTEANISTVYNFLRGNTGRKARFWCIL